MKNRTVESTVSGDDDDVSLLPSVTNENGFDSEIVVPFSLACPFGNGHVSSFVRNVSYAHRDADKNPSDPP